MTRACGAVCAAASFFSLWSRCGEAAPAASASSNVRSPNGGRPALRHRDTDREPKRRSGEKVPGKRARATGRPRCNPTATKLSTTRPGSPLGCRARGFGDEAITDDVLGLTRRQVVGGAAALATLAATGAGQAATTAPAPRLFEATAQGVVFEDADGTGKRGAASKGIAGVMVSNGRDVVLTDAEGRWRLPVVPGKSLFAIKPSGWALPIDPATGLPRFAFVYAPTGTPHNLLLRFKGIAPSGMLPDSIDFPLRRQTESGRFDAVLFTDPQPESLAEVGFIRDDVVAQVVGTEPPSASPPAT